MYNKLKMDISKKSQRVFFNGKCYLVEVELLDGEDEISLLLRRQKPAPRPAIKKLTRIARG